MAGGASQDGDEGMISGINVTPFVDICLVLLIIFMVTAKYIVSQPQIDVNLPKAKNTSTPSVAQVMVRIVIRANGDVFVDTTRVADNKELLAQMIARKAKDPEVRAVIAADNTVPHGKVVEIIDTIRQADIAKFAIQTEMPTATEVSP